MTEPLLERRVVHSCGRFDWQLAVVGDDVTASIHHPGIESIYYTTANFDLGVHEPGDDQLEAIDVVRAYRRNAQVDVGPATLLEAVQEAMDRPTTDVTPEVSPA